MKLMRAGAQRLRAAGLAILVAAWVFSPAAVLATDGMNLEGYGPIATGMGGASMAYDNGAAAMMNNPATLAMMPEGSRLDVALGYLGIDITAQMTGMPDAKSTATSFYMPAIGWVARSGNYAYGIGMFAQGGMGTEYDSSSFMSGFQSMFNFSQGNAGLPTRSEVSVGRVLIPIAYDVNPQFKIGGSVDFVWAGMDLQMVMGGEQMRNMIASFGGSQTFGSISGSMITRLAGFVGGGGPLDPDSPVNWGYFNFSDNSDYSGKAKGTGLAGKIGGVYKVNNQFSLGAAYHSKTSLGDLEASGAQLRFSVNGSDGAAPNGTVGPAMTATVSGKIKIIDFQWPQMLAFGAAYQATNKLMVVADYKWINWKDVMKDFKMSFTAESDTFGNAFVGTVLDATLYQNWKDQNVFMLGAAYAFTDAFTLRLGANLANNPVPDFYMNPLFPAIIKNHYTLGAGIAFTRQSSVDLSMTYAPEVKATNGQGVTVAHSQTNGQVMYSYRF